VLRPSGLFVRFGCSGPIERCLWNEFPDIRVYIYREKEEEEEEDEHHFIFGGKRIKVLKLES